MNYENINLRIGQLTGTINTNINIINELFNLMNDVNSKESIEKINSIIKTCRTNVEESEKELRSLLKTIPIPKTVNQALEEKNKLGLTDNQAMERYFTQDKYIQERRKKNQERKEV